MDTTQLINAVFPAVLSLLGAVISWALAEAASYVRARTKRDAVNDALSRLCHMVETSVAEVNQVVVDELRKKSADGRLTEDEAMKVRGFALAAVKKRMSPEVLKIAASGVTDLTEFLLARIERSVREQRLLSPHAGSWPGTEMESNGGGQ